jgi:hypothetical protein
VVSTFVLFYTIMRSDSPDMVIPTKTLSVAEVDPAYMGYIPVDGVHSFATTHFTPLNSISSDFYSGGYSFPHDAMPSAFGLQWNGIMYEPATRIPILERMLIRAEQKQHGAVAFFDTADEAFLEHWGKFMPRAAFLPLVKKFALRVKKSDASAFILTLHGLYLLVRSWVESPGFYSDTAIKQKMATDPLAALLTPVAGTTTVVQPTVLQIPELTMGQWAAVAGCEVLPSVAADLQAALTLWLRSLAVSALQPTTRDDEQRSVLAKTITFLQRVVSDDGILAVMVACMFIAPQKMVGETYIGSFYLQMVGIDTLDLKRYWEDVLSRALPGCHAEAIITDLEGPIPKALENSWLYDPLRPAISLRRSLHPQDDLSLGKMLEQPTFLAPRPLVLLLRRPEKGLPRTPFADAFGAFEFHGSRLSPHSARMLGKAVAALAYRVPTYYLGRGRVSLYNAPMRIHLVEQDQMAPIVTGLQIFGVGPYENRRMAFQDGEIFRDFAGYLLRPSQSAMLPSSGMERYALWAELTGGYWERIATSDGTFLYPTFRNVPMQAAVFSTMGPRSLYTSLKDRSQVYSHFELAARRCAERSEALANDPDTSKVKKIIVSKRIARFELNLKPGSLPLLDVLPAWETAEGEPCYDATMLVQNLREVFFEGFLWFAYLRYREGVRDAPHIPGGPCFCGCSVV